MNMRALICKWKNMEMWAVKTSFLSIKKDKENGKKEIAD